MSYLPPKMSTEHVIADDIALVPQAHRLKSVWDTLSADLENSRTCFDRWNLRPNPTKTAVSTHHLHNYTACPPLEVPFCDQRVEQTDQLKYLWMTLARTLTLKKHLRRMRAKMKPRLNILRKISCYDLGSQRPHLQDSHCSPPLLGGEVLLPSVGGQNPHQ